MKLDDTLGLFDFRADRNDGQDYLERLYGEPFNLVGSRTVAADAILWMPEDAEYRVVPAPDANVEIGSRAQLAQAFLEFVLLPRRQTDSGSARWVLCYECDPKSLRPRFEVLSDGGNGVLFGRTRG